MHSIEAVCLVPSPTVLAVSHIHQIRDSPVQQSGYNKMQLERIVFVLLKHLC
jgi:hypothetical protein